MIGRKRIILFALYVFLAAGCAGKTEKYSEALHILDRTLECRDEMIRLKEETADSLRKALSAADDWISRYSIEKDLYREYSRFDVDSALVYAHKKEVSAFNSGRKDLMFYAAIDLADRYMVSGSYVDALDIVESLDTVGMSNIQKYDFVNEIKSIYNGLFKTEKDPIRKQFFYNKTLEYIQLIPQETNITPIDSVEFVLNDGKPEIARQMVIDYFNSGKITDEAMLHFWLGKTYKAERDRENEILHYAISANYDLNYPMSVSRSLIRLARLLYREGDTTHAFRYLLAGYEGAARADARIALDEANSFLPQVINSYEALARHQSRLVFSAMLVSILFILVLIQFMVIINKDRKRIRKMQGRIEEENEKLEQQLILIKENNEIKDAYIGRYLSMFSDHIDSLEKYRSRLRQTAKSQDLQDVMIALRDDNPIKDERTALFNEFDRTFLALFPNFVEQLNSLLKEECRIRQNLKQGRLSNELRIFALIRLGVSDSATIARFLKKSPSTIYNYRVKMRNSALSGREDIEKRIMEIGCII